MTPSHTIKRRRGNTAASNGTASSDCQVAAPRLHFLPDDYKINNNYIPFYARLFLAEHPECDGFFQTRGDLAEHHRVEFELFHAEHPDVWRRFYRKARGIWNARYDAARRAGREFPRYSARRIMESVRWDIEWRALQC